MRYAIQVNGHPNASLAGQHAQQFIRAALAKSHQVLVVFFYHDGVFNGLRVLDQVDPAPPFTDGWTELAVKHGLDLVLCVSAAERRGLHAVGPGSVELVPGFRAGGLGQWLDACVRADRCVVFAA